MYDLISTAGVALLVVVAIGVTGMTSLLTPEADVGIIEGTGWREEIPVVGGLAR